MKQKYDLTLVSAFICVFSVIISLTFYFWPYINKSETYKNVIAVFVAALGAGIGYITKVIADKKINKTRTKNIYISYAHGDEAIAENLEKLLSQVGYNPWIDMKNLKPSDNYATTIKSAIHNSEVFIPILTKHAFDRNGNLQKDIKLTLDMIDDKDGNKVSIIPFKLHNLPSIANEIQNNFGKSREVHTHEDLVKILESINVSRKKAKV